MSDENLELLIVDNHPVFREALRTVLNDLRLSAKIFEARDGMEAIRLTKSHRPDIILMDINMPVMNGIEATKRIKSEFPKVKVIGLSSKDGYLEKAIMAAGADRFVSKEMIGIDLYTTILNVVTLN